jgi:ABC-type lipoprotein release transport system permease subunit
LRNAPNSGEFSYAQLRRLGSEAARKLQKDIGQSLRILGEEFRVVEILPPKATVDDCRIYIRLSRCQKLLRKEGQISFILAFLCLHIVIIAVTGLQEVADRKQETGIMIAMGVSRWWTWPHDWGCPTG